MFCFFKEDAIELGNIYQCYNLFKTASLSSLFKDKMYWPGGERDEGTDCVLLFLPTVKQELFIFPSSCYYREVFWPPENDIWMCN